MDSPRTHPKLPTAAPIAPILLAVFLLAPSCGSASDPDRDPAPGSSLDGTTITVYSGRSEELIQPVFDAFEAATGARVAVRYLESAEAALLIDAEGDQSPADVVISQSPGAIGFLDEAGRLAPLDDTILDRVEPDFRDSDGTWVGITGRVRTLVYNTDLVDPAELPASVLDLVEPAYAGRVAVAPANGSFQDFVTAMRSELGDEATATWLEGMAANESPNYAKNSAIVDAVTRGEVPMGLVNHYYLPEALEEDPGLPGANHFFPAGDLGSLLIVSAAAVVDSSGDPDSAAALIAYLLSDEAQAVSASAEKEYPLVSGVAAPAGLAPLDDAAAVVIDLDVLAGGLARTQELIDESGIQQ